MRLHLAVALLLASVAITHARDYYVDPALGDEQANGLAAQADGTNGPVQTIARGIKLAQPGDTVHLAPTMFKESAVFVNRRGEPGKPIILDGHGATLDGGEPIDPAAWTEISPGLFRHDHLFTHLDDATMQRWFFLWGGKMNHMGRTSKGKSAPLKKPEDLQPGEWTFVRDDTRKLPDSQQIFGTFYLKLPPSQSLAQAAIIAPMRSAGVQLSGDNRHLVIRHVTSTHVYNDGFNIHGHCEDVLFEDIRAVECGDDGISAHETAEYRVEGFVSIGNSTGICDTGPSVTTYDRVFIKDCLGFDLFFLDSGRHAVSNSFVLSSSVHALAVSGREQAEQPCSLTLDNVLIRRANGATASDARVAKNSVLTARRTTFQDLNFQAAGGEITLDRCVVRGTPRPEMSLAKEVQWHAENNIYELRELRFDKTRFTPETFVDFQKLTGQETGSQWRAAGAEALFPAAIGADVTMLETGDVPPARKP